MKDLEQLRKQTKETAFVATELLKRNIEIKYKNKVAMFYNDYLKSASNVATIGIIMGISLTILGFALWYIRLQKFQDLVLLKEAEQKQIVEKTNKQVSKKRPRLKA